MFLARKCRALCFAKLLRDDCVLKDTLYKTVSVKCLLCVCSEIVVGVSFRKCVGCFPFSIYSFKHIHH